MAGDSKSIVAAVAEVNDLKNAISDLKKEIDEALDSLNNFGRVGALSVRNLGAEARTLQSSFRDISREFKRMSTPSGTIGAAATSQALGQLTGRGGGGGGGGGAGGRPGMGLGGNLGGAAGNLVGTAGSAVSTAIGGILSKIPIIGPMLGSLVTTGGRTLSKAGALGATAAMTGGLGFLEGAVSRQMGIEQAGRSYGGWERMMPSPLGEDKTSWGARIEGGPEAFYGPKPGRAHLRRAAGYGFNAEEIMRASFGARYLQKPGKGLEKFVAGTMLPATTSFGLGVDQGQLQDFTGAMVGAGRSLGQAGGIMGGARAVYAQGGSADPRRSVALLDSIKTSIGQLVSAQGYATQAQVTGAATLHRALEKRTGYDPMVLPSVVGRLGAAARSPGGGEAGKIAMLQTLGFGMPNLGFQQGLAGRMGITNPERYGKRRNYLEGILKMQGLGADEAGEALMLTARRVGGEDQLHQANVLSSLTGMSMPETLKLVQTAVGERGEGWLSELGQSFKSKQMGDVTAAAPGGKEFKDSIKLLREHMRMINLSLSIPRKDLASIARSITKIKIALIDPMTKMLTSLPDQIEKIVKAITALLKGMDLAAGEIKSNMDHAAASSATIKHRIAGGSGKTKGGRNAPSTVYEYLRDLFIS